MLAKPIIIITITPRVKGNYVIKNTGIDNVDSKGNWESTDSYFNIIYLKSKCYKYTYFNSILLNKFYKTKYIFKT